MIESLVILFGLLTLRVLILFLFTGMAVSTEGMLLILRATGLFWEERASG